MRKIKSIISILLSIVLLLSSISVGSIVAFAEGTTLTKIENTFDDEGVEYTTTVDGLVALSTRIVNNKKPENDNKFSAWGASVEKFSENNNAVMDFVKKGTKAEMHSWQHNMISNFFRNCGTILIS